MSKPYKVLIIGAGAMGTNHYNTLLQFQEEERVEIVGVVDPRDEALENFEGRTNTYSSIEEALTEQSIDAVMISSNTEAHGSNLETLLASNQRPTIFMEKPIVGDMKTAESLYPQLQQAGYTGQEGGIPISTAYLIRSSKIVEDSITYINERELEITDIDITWKKSRGNNRATAGVHIDETTHGIDTALSYILKQTSKTKLEGIQIGAATRRADEIEEKFYNKDKQAKLYTNESQLNPIGEVQYEISVEQVKIRGFSSFVSGPQERKIKIKCKDKGGKTQRLELEFDNNGEDKLVTYENEQVVDVKAYNGKMNPKYQKVYLEWEHFLNYMDSGVRPDQLPSLEDALVDLQITEAFDQV